MSYKDLNGINDIKTAPMLKDENGALHIMQLSVELTNANITKDLLCLPEENTHWNMSDYIK